MSIFKKFQRLEESGKKLKKEFGAFFNVVLEEIISSTEAVINGKRVILAGTNNYLGLSMDDSCIEAACQALRNEGTGTTGSRMANGTFSGHVKLEKELSSFWNRSHTIVFTTGYGANLAVLSSLAGPGEIVLLDSDCHASIYDGCRMGGADIFRFRHNDVKDLEKRLKRLSERGTNILIAVEGLYSMLGDRAKLEEIAEIKQKYGAYLLIDEAHSLGVLGDNGRGLVEESGVNEQVDFITGTFSKSLGSVGGFCSSNHPEIETLRYASRPYVFTASPSPANIAAARKALDIIIHRPDLRKRLWDNTYSLHERLSALGLSLGPEITPIIPVRYQDPDEALSTWTRLLENGVYVNMVLPPATPDGSAFLRCSLSAAHTARQIEAIAEAFEKAAAAGNLH